MNGIPINFYTFNFYSLYMFRYTLLSMVLVFFFIRGQSQELLVLSGSKHTDEQCNKAIRLVTQDAAANFTAAIKILDKARLDAQKTDNKRAVCVTYFAEATVLKRIGAFDPAGRGLKKALEVAGKIISQSEKAEMLAYCHHYLGFIYQSQSDWEKSLNSYYTGLEFAKKMPDKSEYLMILTRIGDIFQAMGDGKNAEKYFMEAQKADDLKNPVMSIEILIAYANMLLETTPEKAVEMSRKALEIAEKYNITRKNYNIYFNLSGAYFIQNRLPDAIAMMDTAIADAKRQNKSLTQFYLGLAQIMEADKQPGLSEDNYLKAIGEARKEKDRYMEMQSVSYLKNFYKSTGQTEKLIQTMERESTLKDSVRSSQMAIATQEMDYRYQTEKKENAITELTRANRLKTFLMIVSLIAMAAILLLLRNRRKQAGLRENYFKSREEMLQQQAQIERQNTLIEKEAKEKAQLSEKLNAEENFRLQREVETTNRELATTTLYIQEKNRLLENLQEQISKLLDKSDDPKNKNELKDISRNIKNQMAFENDWPKIKMHFEKVHPDFFAKLSAIGPTLTQNDLKNCAYIRMKLTHKEIANLLGVDYNSVKMARYRIKKKLDLDKEADLNEFVESL